jgi:hypothetical protein
MGDIEKREGGNTALVDIESARAVQEVQGAIVIARKFPRDQKEARERILQECRRPALADAAIYAYPRGGQTVSGPSIRMAEAIGQNWGNFQFGVRELSQANGMSTAQAYAWDVERNVRAEKTFQIPHTRYVKDKGNVRLTDPRDIYEMVANQGARRVRACILSLIPGDIVDAALAECEKTQNDHGDVTAEKVKGMLTAFAEVGVNRQVLETYLKHRAEECTRAEVKALSRIMLSIRDGMSKPEEFFPALRAAAGGKVEAVKDAAARKAAEAGGKGPLARMFGGKQAQPVPFANPTVDPQTGDIIEGEPGQGGLGLE